MPALLYSTSTGRSPTAAPNAAIDSPEPVSSWCTSAPASSSSICRRRIAAAADHGRALRQVVLGQRQAETTVGPGDDDSGHEVSSSTIRRAGVRLMTSRNRSGRE